MSKKTLNLPTVLFDIVTRFVGNSIELNNLNIAQGKPYPMRTISLYNVADWIWINGDMSCLPNSMELQQSEKLWQSTGESTRLLNILYKMALFRRNMAFCLWLFTINPHKMMALFADYINPRTDLDNEVNSVTFITTLMHIYPPSTAIGSDIHDIVEKALDRRIRNYLRDSDPDHFRFICRLGAAFQYWPEYLWPRFVKLYIISDKWIRKYRMRYLIGVLNNNNVAYRICRPTHSTINSICKEYNWSEEDIPSEYRHEDYLREIIGVMRQYAI